MSNGKVVLPIIGVLLIGAAVFFWSSRGYGEVSPDAYAVSKALVGACQAKSSERLEAVIALLDKDADTPLSVSDTERGWLESIIKTAKGGDWEFAAKSARRMMDDQVEY